MLLTFFASILLSSISHTSFPQQPILSPRDSTEIIIKGKKISVNYGRPSMRGRTIMGGLVPYNKVWRTGANEATAFETETDLEFDGVVLPRGSYTLYTLPSAGPWKLIINKQTGQWGTVYNPELDFARLPMKKEPLKNPVETLTISFRRNGTDGVVLVLEWEYTILSIPFKVLNNNTHQSKSKL
ncbi:MAG: DUF2911 domain-containing protein [Ignavibacteriales bacterium]|nr:DUF2911 domain-containing protein [Ignavibacteriales bacterium]